MQAVRQELDHGVTYSGNDNRGQQDCRDSKDDHANRTRPVTLSTILALEADGSRSEAKAGHQGKNSDDRQYEGEFAELAFVQVSCHDDLDGDCDASPRDPEQKRHP
jgi:hypothetical protein